MVYREERVRVYPGKEVDIQHRYGLMNISTKSKDIERYLEPYRKVLEEVEWDTSGGGSPEGS